MENIAVESPEGLNLQNVLSLVEKADKPSRAGIAKRLNLSRTTVSTLVARLMEAGIVTELGAEIDGRGRPGIALDIATDRWFSVGAEFHSGQWVFVLTDMKGRIVGRSSRPLEHVDPATFLKVLCDGLKDIIPGTPGHLLPAIGIGTPGLVDCDSGTIVRADDLGWKDVRVGEYIAERVGYPVHVVNRHRASGLAEARFGAGVGVHNFIYIGIGTGISAAIISEGVLLHGASYSAGEIGHMTMRPNGILCRCGKKGCLQTLASGTAMRDMLLDEIAAGRDSSLKESIQKGENITGETIAAEAARGDALSLTCVRKAASWLAMAIANLNAIFNPDKIIIGGPIGQLPGPFIDILRRKTEKYNADSAFETIRIEQGSLGENTGALGASCLILDRKFDLIFRD